MWRRKQATAGESCLSRFKNIRRTFLNRRRSVWAHPGRFRRRNRWRFDLLPHVAKDRQNTFAGGKQRLLVKWEMRHLLREPRPVQRRLRCAGLLAWRANANMYFKSQVFVGPTPLFPFHDHVTLLIAFRRASSPLCHGDTATACRRDVKKKKKQNRLLQFANTSVRRPAWHLLAVSSSRITPPTLAPGIWPRPC